jgi:hypothetical protein
MRYLTTEELDRESRVHRGRCRECGRPILGRPRNATTCLVHRAYLGAPGRDEMVRLIEEHEALVRALREALSRMDEGAEA